MPTPYQLPDGRWVNLPDDPAARAELERAIASRYPGSQPSTIAPASSFLTALDPLPSRKPPVPQEMNGHKEGTILGSAWEGIKQVPFGLMDVPLSIAESIIGVATPHKDYDIEKWLRRAGEYGSSKIDPMYAESFLPKVGMGIGQVAGMVLAGMSGAGIGGALAGTARAAKVGSSLLGNTAMFSLGISDQTRRIAETEHRTGRRISAPRQTMAHALGALTGFTEKMALGKYVPKAWQQKMGWTKAANKLVSGGLKAADEKKLMSILVPRLGELGKAGVTGLGAEAVQEAGQQFLQAGISRTLYDPNAMDNILASMAEDAKVGGAVGGIAGVFMDLMANGLTGGRRTGPTGPRGSRDVAEGALARGNENAERQAIKDRESVIRRDNTGILNKLIADGASISLTLSKYGGMDLEDESVGSIDRAIEQQEAARTAALEEVDSVDGYDPGSDGMSPEELKRNINDVANQNISDLRRAWNGQSAAEEDQYSETIGLPLRNVPKLVWDNTVKTARNIADNLANYWGDEGGFAVLPGAGDISEDGALDLTAVNKAWGDQGIEGASEFVNETGANADLGLELAVSEFGNRPLNTIRKNLLDAEQELDELSKEIPLDAPSEEELRLKREAQDRVRLLGNELEQGELARMNLDYRPGATSDNARVTPGELASVMFENNILADPISGFKLAEMEFEAGFWTPPTTEVAPTVEAPTPQVGAWPEAGASIPGLPEATLPPLEFKSRITKDEQVDEEGSPLWSGDPSVFSNFADLRTPDRPEGMLYRDRVLGDVQAKTVEHAYQAQKFDDPEIRRQIYAMEKPGQVKNAVKDLPGRTDFGDEEAKAIIKDIVRQKFAAGTTFRDFLKSVPLNRKIEEKSTGRDSRWRRIMREIYDELRVDILEEEGALKTARKATIDAISEAVKETEPPDEVEVGGVPMAVPDAREGRIKTNISELNDTEFTDYVANQMQPVPGLKLLINAAQKEPLKKDADIFDDVPDYRISGADVQSIRDFIEINGKPEAVIVPKTGQGKVSGRANTEVLDLLNKMGVNVSLGREQRDSRGPNSPIINTDASSHWEELTEIAEDYKDALDTLDTLLKENLSDKQKKAFKSSWDLLSKSKDRTSKKNVSVVYGESSYVDEVWRKGIPLALDYKRMLLHEKQGKSTSHLTRPDPVTGPANSVVLKRILNARESKNPSITAAANEVVRQVKNFDEMVKEKSVAWKVRNSEIVSELAPSHLLLLGKVDKQSEDFAKRFTDPGLKNEEDRLNRALRIANKDNDTAGIERLSLELTEIEERLKPDPTGFLTPYLLASQKTRGGTLPIDYETGRTAARAAQTATPRIYRHQSELTPVEQVARIADMTEKLDRLHEYDIGPKVVTDQDGEQRAETREEYAARMEQEVGPFIERSDSIGTLKFDRNRALAELFTTVLYGAKRLLSESRHSVGLTTLGKRLGYSTNEDFGRWLNQAIQKAEKALAVYNHFDHMTQQEIEKRLLFGFHPVTPERRAAIEKGVTVSRKQYHMPKAAVFNANDIVNVSKIMNKTDAAAKKASDAIFDMQSIANFTNWVSRKGIDSREGFAERATAEVLDGFMARQKKNKKVKDGDIEELLKVKNILLRSRTRLGNLVGDIGFGFESTPFVKFLKDMAGADSWKGASNAQRRLMYSKLLSLPSQKGSEAIYMPNLYDGEVLNSYKRPIIDHLLGKVIGTEGNNVNDIYESVLGHLEEDFKEGDFDEALAQLLESRLVQESDIQVLRDAKGFTVEVAQLSGESDADHKRRVKKVTKDVKESRDNYIKILEENEKEAALREKRGEPPMQSRTKNLLRRPLRFGPDTKGSEWIHKALSLPYFGQTSAVSVADLMGDSPSALEAVIREAFAEFYPDGTPNPSYTLLRNEPRELMSNEMPELGPLLESIRLELNPDLTQSSRGMVPPPVMVLAGGPLVYEKTPDKLLKSTKGNQRKVQELGQLYYRNSPLRSKHLVRFLKDAIELDGMPRIVRLPQNENTAKWIEALRNLGVSEDAIEIVKTPWILTYNQKEILKQDKPTEKKSIRRRPRVMGAQILRAEEAAPEDKDFGLETDVEFKARQAEYQRLQDKVRKPTASYAGSENFTVEKIILHIERAYEAFGVPIPTLPDGETHGGASRKYWLNLANKLTHIIRNRQLLGLPTRGGRTESSIARGTNEDPSIASSPAEAQEAEARYQRRIKDRATVFLNEEKVLKPWDLIPPRGKDEDADAYRKRIRVHRDATGLTESWEASVGSGLDITRAREIVAKEAQKSAEEDEDAKWLAFLNKKGIRPDQLEDIPGTAKELEVEFRQLMNVTADELPLEEGVETIREIEAGAVENRDNWDADESLNVREFSDILYSDKHTEAQNLVEGDDAFFWEHGLDPHSLGLGKRGEGVFEEADLNPKFRSEDDNIRMGIGVRSLGPGQMQESTPEGDLIVGASVESTFDIDSPTAWNKDLREYQVDLLELAERYLNNNQGTEAELGLDGVFGTVQTPENLESISGRKYRRTLRDARAALDAERQERTELWVDEIVYEYIDSKTGMGQLKRPQLGKDGKPVTRLRKTGYKRAKAGPDKSTTTLALNGDMSPKTLEEISDRFSDTEGKVLLDRLTDNPEAKNKFTELQNLVNGITGIPLTQQEFASNYHTLLAELSPSDLAAMGPEGIDRLASLLSAKAPAPLGSMREGIFDVSAKGLETERGTVVPGDPSGTTRVIRKEINEINNRHKELDAEVKAALIEIGADKDVVVEYVADLHSLWQLNKDVAVTGEAISDDVQAVYDRIGNRIIINLSIIDPYDHMSASQILRQAAFHEGIHHLYLTNRLSNSEVEILFKYVENTVVDENIDSEAHRLGQTYYQWKAIDPRYANLNMRDLKMEASIDVLTGLASGEISAKKSAGAIGVIKKDLVSFISAFVDPAKKSGITPIVAVLNKVMSGEVGAREATTLSEGISADVDNSVLAGYAVPEELDALKLAIQLSKESKTEEERIRYEAEAEAIIKKITEVREAIKEDAPEPPDELRQTINTVKLGEINDDTSFGGVPILNSVDQLQHLVEKYGPEFIQAHAWALDEYIKMRENPEYSGYTMPSRFSTMLRKTGSIQTDVQRELTQRNIDNKHFSSVDRDRTSIKYNAPAADGQSIDKTTSTFLGWTGKMRQNYIDAREKVVEQQRHLMEMDEVAYQQATTSALVALRWHDQLLAYMPGLLGRGPPSYVGKSVLEGDSGFKQEFDPDLVDPDLNPEGKIPSLEDLFHGNKELGYEGLPSELDEVAASAYGVAQRIRTADEAWQAAVAAHHKAKGKPQEKGLKLIRDKKRQDLYDLIQDPDTKKFHFETRKTTASGASIVVQTWDQWVQEQLDVYGQNKKILEFWKYQRAFNKKMLKWSLDTGLITKEIHDEYVDKMWTPFYSDEVGHLDASVFGPGIQDFRGSNKIEKAIRGGPVTITGDLKGSMERAYKALIRDGGQNVAIRRINRDTMRFKEAVQIDPSQMPEGSPIGGQTLVRSMNKGVPEWHQYDDVEYAKSIMIGGVNPRDVIAQMFGDGVIGDLVAKAFLGMAQVLRETVTRMPPYMFKNLTRDAMDADVTLGNGPPLWFAAMKNAFTPSSLERAADLNLAVGLDVMSHGGVAEEVYQARFRRELADVNWLNPLSVVAAVWQGLGRMASQSEVAVRLAIYDRVMAMDIPTMTKAEQKAMARYLALELLNFGRRGAQPFFRTFLATVPFMNGRIAGVDKLWRVGLSKRVQDVPDLAVLAMSPEEQRAYMADPKNRGKQIWKRRRLAMYRRGLMLATMSGIYYVLMHDDEEYKLIREETKADNWLIPMSKSRWLKIPIPFEIGVLFKVFPEQMMKLIMEKETNISDVSLQMKRQLRNSLSVGPPQLIAPFVDAIRNNDAYRGDFIVDPITDQIIEPSEQYNRYTSNVARGLAKMTNTIPLVNQLDFLTSPQKLEYMMRQFLGTAGSYGIVLADRAARSGILPFVEAENVVGTTYDFDWGSLIGGEGMANIPLLGDMLIDPRRGNENVQTLYEMVREMDRFIATKGRITERDWREGMEYMNQNLQYEAYKGELRSLERAMANVTEHKEFIMDRPGLSDDEKRVRVRRVTEMTNRILGRIQDLRVRLRTKPQRAR